jgi:hypothetical protein
MTRTWRCRRVKAGEACGTLNLRIKQKCTACGAPRPKRKQPAHRAVLAEMPYEQWVAIFGETCGICGIGPSETRRLDRDHDHKTGDARGLLCHRCNRALPNWASVEWLLAAARYLEPRLRKPVT